MNEMFTYIFTDVEEELWRKLTKNLLSVSPIKPCRASFQYLTEIVKILRLKFMARKQIMSKGLVKIPFWMLKAVYYLQEGAIKWKNLIDERNL